MQMYLNFLFPGNITLGLIGFFFSSLARFHKYLNTSLIDFYILGSQKLSENFRALFVEITGVKFQGHSSTCVFGKYEF